MRTLHVRGRDLAVRESGDGEPVVLLHAFPLTGEMWRPQLEALSAGMRLVAPDLAGFGGSAPPPDPGAWSVDDYADDVAAMLDELGIDRAIVGGLSMGGYVAMALLRRHPDRVKALILADTRAAADAPEAKAKREAQAAMIREGRSREVVEGLLPALLAPATLENRHDLVARVRAQMESVSPDGFLAALEAMKNRPDSTELLAGTRVPALLLCGAADALTPPELMQALAGTIPGARLQVIPEAGHLASLESPASFGREVAGFVAAVAGLREEREARAP